jgi:hypothetical protein
MKFTSSPLAADGAAAGVLAVAAPALAAGGVWVAVASAAGAGGIAVGVGAVPSALPRGLGTTPGVVMAVTAAAPAAPLAGGTTRSTWPTSRILGLTMLFQACRSRHPCPLSSAIRNRVSPGRTV